MLLLNLTGESAMKGVGWRYLAEITTVIDGSRQGAPGIGKGGPCLDENDHGGGVF